MSSVSTDEFVPNPNVELRKKAQEMQVDVLSGQFPLMMDEKDPLRSFRDKFCFPKKRNLPFIDKNLPDLDSDCIYLIGNSLGLKPKSADLHMEKYLKDWSDLAAVSHFHGSIPALSCDLRGIQSTAKLIGAKPEEVALMNGLTVNIHLLMVSFYHPTKQRSKILMEAGAFPSDRYALKSQIRYHGYDPQETLIQMRNKEGEDYLKTEDILELIEKEGDSIAVIFFSGIQFYTGQKFEIEKITAAGHAKGCFVGFDIAHAIGNVELELHDWGVDFACWCSYKYLNSGAGGMAGAFIHEKHNACQLRALHGWWSNIEETRFDMNEDPDLSIGVAALRISNPPPALACLNLAGLEIFDETSMKELTAKQFLLTGYLELLLSYHFIDIEQPLLKIITPRDPHQRGCQLSLKFKGSVENIEKMLGSKGVLCDVRKPDVLRIAPAPLYVSFHDVYDFVQVLKGLLFHDN